MTDPKPLVIAGRLFSTRLLVGTGKFSSAQLMKDAIKASGAEIVTTAIRRVDLTNPNDSFITHISPKSFFHQLFGGFEGVDGVGEEIVGFWGDFEFDPG